MVIVIFAGPNGSGKSTAYETLDIGQNISYPYINADNIQKELKISAMEAAQVATKMRESAVEKGTSFCFETVMSTDRHILLLEKAKNKGYKIKAFYVLTKDPTINISRVRFRVENGGHDVPEDKIVSRYYKSLQLLPRLYNLADELLVIDNSKIPEIILRKKENTLQIIENDNFSQTDIRKLIGLSEKGVKGF